MSLGGGLVVRASTEKEIARIGMPMRATFGGADGPAHRNAHKPSAALNSRRRRSEADRQGVQREEFGSAGGAVVVGILAPGLIAAAVADALFRARGARR